MKRSLALIHTVTRLVPVFEDLVRQHLPEWEPFNIVDESLLRNAIRDSRVTEMTMRRVAAYIGSAVDGGADAILVTCSSIGPAVDAARPFCAVPLVRVDEGMADRAIEIGGRIGILATLSTTLEPTRDLILKRAAACGGNPTLVSRVCEDAFAVLARGDQAGHDDIVAQELLTLAREVDVVVLAQASMARVLGGLPGEQITIPVLASPELGVLNLKARLAA